MVTIEEMYGHGCQIARWAQRDSIQIDPTLYEAVASEIEHRERIATIADKDLTEAITLMNMVNEIAPDYTQKVALFSSKLVNKAIRLLDTPTLAPDDLTSLAKAVQTSTDTVGVTQRHASAASITNNSVKVTGFDFVLDDTPPLPDPRDSRDVIDATTTDEETP